MKDIISIAESILNGRFFPTINDYNKFCQLFPCESVAILDNISEKNMRESNYGNIISAHKRVLKLIDKQNEKINARMSKGRTIGSSAGALNRDIHNLGAIKDELIYQKNKIESELNRRCSFINYA